MSPKEKKERPPGYIFALATAILTFVMAGLTFVMLVVAIKQFQATEKASVSLTSRLERLDTVMSNLEEGIDSLSITVVDFDEGLSGLVEQQKIVRLNLERKPLVVITGQGVSINDSIAVVRFSFLNLGDRATEDARALIELPQNYRVDASEGIIRVMPDNRMFWIYYTERLYSASPEHRYKSVIPTKVYIKPINGIIEDTIEMKARIYLVEREPYEHYFPIFPNNPQGLNFWKDTPFLQTEMERIKARRSAITK